jgi:DNA-binding FrmR family transcriptional regulator
MYKIKISPEERKNLVNSLKKIVGQLQSVIDIVENDKIREQTLTQLLAVKGGTTRVCKDIISHGILKNIKDYKYDDLDKALSIIFKLDS